jgi:hypothetical protein
VAEHAVYGLEVLLAFVVESLRLLLEFLEPPLSVDVDGIFRVLTDVELVLELLRRL